MAVIQKNEMEIVAYIVIMISYSQGMDLRVEHFHCFSEHGQGGHYHFDTTPNEVEYRGYFMLADYVYRVDQPPQTTALARWCDDCAR